MPFEAAKAVAATFCYPIRYALTPLFGLDFPSRCLVPEDRDFANMIIDKSIVSRCTDQARGYREMSIGTPLDESPVTPSSLSSFSKWPSRSLRPKPAKTMDIESDRCTDTSFRDGSPIPMHRAYPFTAMHMPRSTDVHHNRLPSPAEMLAGVPVGEDSEEPPDTPRTSSSKGNVRAKRTLPDVVSDVDEEYDASRSSSESSEAIREAPKRRKTSHSPSSTLSDVEAARILMRLNMEDATLGDDANGKER